MLTFVVGTRPEAIKVAPVVKACQAIGLETTVIHTGQHTDLLLGTGLTPDLSLPHYPPTDLGPDGDRMRDALRPHLGYLTVVQGDTLSAYAGTAAVITSEGKFLYHIEAGVRSGDLQNPRPEEGYRQFIDEWAHAGCCATEANQRNLNPNRRDLSWFPVTGNPGIDALYAIQQPIPVEQRKPHVLVTLHRRESWGEPLNRMALAIRDLARQHDVFTFLWPAHPSIPVQDAVLPLRLDLPMTMRILAPLPHQELLKRLARCTAVITDSGGIQEEAAALGIPCVVCREVTDRPESVATNQAVVVGRDPDRIMQGFERALTELSREPSECFGDGKSAPRIAAHLASLLN